MSSTAREGYADASTEKKMAKASSHFSMDEILGHLEYEGRGIVNPCSPILRLSWELMASVRREDSGNKLAKSTYSPFVMAVVVVLERWLAREGCLKFG